MRTSRPPSHRPILVGLLTLLGAGCHSDSDSSRPPAEAPDPPELLAGERLFLEARFAQFFAANAGGNLNLPLASGDPALDMILLDGKLVASPFAGSTMSCATCHMVDQALDLAGGGIRTYGDFAVQSPITARPDGELTSPRNSPPLVNASISRVAPDLFHLDGEFAALEDLVGATLRGRNMGWQASEGALAEAHIASVIRQDDGMGELADEFGNVAYADLLDTANLGVPEEFELPMSFRIDMSTATDTQIVAAVASLVAAYTSDLAFARDDDDLYSGSPYDSFLALNGLPQEPGMGEAPLDYARRLAGEIDALSQPRLVNGPDFEFHDQDFRFGQEELDGLKIFLTEAAVPPGSGGAGNCVACHTPPDFTDFLFHNAGFTQNEYDDVHGPGGFMMLSVPDLMTRNGDPNQYLPPSAANPTASGPFRAVVDSADPSRTDLGLWNVFANPAMPNPQTAIDGVLDLTFGAGTSAMSDDALLPMTLGLFKTPSLRDLSHAQPYGHSGNFTTLGEVLIHYVEFSGLASGSFVRNGDSRLADIDLMAVDLAPLEAFLRSLNEDYD